MLERYSTASWPTISKIVYKRTYAREVATGVTENWGQTVERFISGNVRGFDVPEEEVNKLRHFAGNVKSLPAGRGIWFSGAAAHERLGGAATVNCWFLTGDDWENIVVAQDLLMLGGGVGFSVEQQFTGKLPKIKSDVKIVHTDTKDADFIVPDSREGWNELTRKVLESFFVTGKSFSYSTVCIRGNGESIKGFGGKASGPLPLIEFIRKVSSVLSSREGKHLRSIDLADIVCAVGEMVVAGNVRRSAIIIIGDAWDKEYLKAKRWDLGPIPTQRSRANFSVVADDIDDLHPLYWETYHHGEAFGLVNRKNIQQFARMGHKKKDTAIGVNPCFSGDTPILTTDGYKPIKSLVGEEDLLLFNSVGEPTPGKVWSNGFKNIVEIEFKGGETIRCTPDHLFLLSDFIEEVAQNLEGKTVRAAFCRSSVEEYDKVISVTPLEDLEEVFDFALFGDSHWGVVGNDHVAHNCGEIGLESKEPCNLIEHFLPHYSDVMEFADAARVFHRYGKRVTLQNYHNPDIEKVIRKNMRVGHGITGCLQSPLFNQKDLDYVYRAIEEEDAIVSKLYGVGKSIRLTTVKPSGTLSLLGNTTAGIHPGFSRFFIRRIRFSSSDPLLKSLRDAGYYMEPEIQLDGSLSEDTMVVDFPMMTPEGTPVADEDWDTWKQLEVVKNVQKWWSDNSVSVTVYYRKEEIPAIKEWLRNNLDEIKTISFLCHNDHGFKQAPIEAIDEDKFVSMSKGLAEIDADSIGNGGMDLAECEGGVCPIK